MLFQHIVWCITSWYPVKNVHICCQFAREMKQMYLDTYRALLACEAQDCDFLEFIMTSTELWVYHFSLKPNKLSKSDFIIHFLSPKYFE